MVWLAIVLRGDTGRVLRRVDPSRLPLSANLSLLGINGLTAYLCI